MAGLPIRVNSKRHFVAHSGKKQFTKEMTVGQTFQLVDEPRTSHLQKAKAQLLVTDPSKAPTAGTPSQMYKNYQVIPHQQHDYLAQ